MLAWDKTWNPHHLPVWAKKMIRQNALKKGKWNPWPSYPVTNDATIHLPSDLFDHWGSVKRGNVRALITQPYHNRDKEAEAFAKELGWQVKSSHPGPWNEGTWLYEFLPANV